MTELSDLRNNSYAVFRDWMYGAALPFWSTVGCDRDGHGFVEHLTLDGVPAEIGYKRTRVQARQIFVFANAESLGWKGGIDVARRGYEFLVRHGWRPEGGWACRMGRVGGIVDAAADLYDIAFVLFALAWYGRIAKSDEAIGLAYRTVDWLEATMKAPFGGFHNVVPTSGEFRQQNPHMHLLEAMLALYETTNDTVFLERGKYIIELFLDHFYDAGTGTLGEFFGENWSWAPGEAGTHVEPGHHYEWVWLLKRYEALTGHSLSHEADTLYRFAHEFGVDAESGLVFDVVDRSGVVRKGTFRLWPQTEAIKAHLVMKLASAVATKPLYVARINRTIDNLLRFFLSNKPAGTWMDQISSGGGALVEKIPSSSLYHIAMMFSETERFNFAEAQ